MGAARTKYFPAAWNVEAKPCDFCTSAAAVVFCRADSAFMCIACDTKVHNGIETHGRVWMCEVCEHAPAAVTCKADAAALCVDCDHDIHSANPLASRHDRVPVVPFYDSAELMVMKSADAVSFLVPGDGVFADSSPTIDADRKVDTGVITSGFISDSWISNTTPILTSKFPADNPEMKAVDFLFSDDQFLDFDNYQISSQPYSDTAVVPVHATVKLPLQPQISHQPSTENRFEINFAKSNITSYNNYTTPSLSHSFSSSSMEVGVVPDGSAMSEISYPLAKSVTSSAADQVGNHGSLAGGSDRRARVLRYKEKRKNRKFEKTIRYASRKAYAETRPRIKGRFAKRTDAEPDMDGLFGYGCGNYGADARFGVVPSF